MGTQAVHLALMFVSAMFTQMSWGAATSPEGTWKSNCLGGTTVSTFLFADDGSFDRTERQYLEHDCTKDGIEFRYRGQWSTESSDSFTRSGPLPLDLELASVQVTLLDSFLVWSHNLTKFCGYSDWTVGQPKDVTGLDCQGLKVPPKGDLLHTIFNLEDKMLLLGRGDDKHPGDLPSTRHIELANDHPLFLQNP